MKNIFEGSIKDFEGKIDKEEATRQYEKIKDPIIDAKARELAKVWYEFVTVAMEKENGLSHIESAIEAIIGGVLIGEINYRWQLDLVDAAWKSMKMLVTVEMKRHGID